MGLPTVGKSSAVALVGSPVQQGLAFFVLLRGDLACSEAPLQDSAWALADGTLPPGGPAP